MTSEQTRILNVLCSPHARHLEDLCFSSVFTHIYKQSTCFQAKKSLVSVTSSTILLWSATSTWGSIISVTLSWQVVQQCFQVHSGHYRALFDIYSHFFDIFTNWSVNARKSSLGHNEQKWIWYIRSIKEILQFPAQYVTNSRSCELFSDTHWWMFLEESLKHRSNINDVV